MTISQQDALTRLIEHREIFHDEMLFLFRKIMSGEMSPVMIAALTVALRVKKESIGEITAAAQVMRELSTKVPMANTTNQTSAAKMIFVFDTASFALLELCSIRFGLIVHPILTCYPNVVR